MTEKSVKIDKQNELRNQQKEWECGGVRAKASCAFPLVGWPLSWFSTFSFFLFHFCRIRSLTFLIHAFIERWRYRHFNDSCACGNGAAQHSMIIYAKKKRKKSKIIHRTIEFITCGYSVAKTEAFRDQESWFNIQPGFRNVIAFNHAINRARQLKKKYIYVCMRVYLFGFHFFLYFHCFFFFLWNWCTLQLQ